MTDVWKAYRYRLNNRVKDKNLDIRDISNLLDGSIMNNLESNLSPDYMLSN